MVKLTNVLINTRQIAAPFGKNCVNLFESSEICLDNFAEMRLKFFADILLENFEEIFLGKLCWEIFWGTFFGEIFLGNFCWETIFQGIFFLREMVFQGNFF